MGWVGGWINEDYNQLSPAIFYWPIDGGSVIRLKFKNGFEVYSLSSVTSVYYRELNSSSFILVRWVGGWINRDYNQLMRGIFCYAP